MKIFKLFKDVLKAKHKHFLYINYNTYKRYGLIFKFLVSFNKNYKNVKIYRYYKYHGKVVVFGLRYYGRNVKRRANGYAKDWVRNNRNSTCIYCNTDLTIKNATVDHILPISKGGINTKVNFIVCCENCNSERGDEDFYYFLKKKSGKKYGFIDGKFIK